jgi:hypothetical protein
MSRDVSKGDLCLTLRLGKEHVGLLQQRIADIERLSVSYRACCLLFAVCTSVTTRSWSSPLDTS